MLLHRKYRIPRLHRRLLTPASVYSEQAPWIDTHAPNVQHNRSKAGAAANVLKSRADAKNEAGNRQQSESAERRSPPQKSGREFW